MTVKDTNYYMDLGREHAADPSAPTPFKRESTSWQARAYWSGYNGKLMPLTGATTGRISSHDPAPQTPPPRTAEGKKVIAAVRPFGAVFTAPPTTSPTQPEKTPTGPDPEAAAPSSVGVKLPPPVVAGTFQLDGQQSIDGWPDAPRSHYLELTRQLNRETDQRRRERLQRSMERMYERWSSKSIRLL